MLTPFAQRSPPRSIGQQCLPPAAVPAACWRPAVWATSGPCLDERHQRRHHDGHALRQHRGQLVAQALAAACGSVRARQLGLGASWLNSCWRRPCLHGPAAAAGLPPRAVATTASANRPASHRCPAARPPAAPVGMSTKTSRLSSVAFMMASWLSRKSGLPNMERLVLRRSRLQGNVSWRHLGTQWGMVGRAGKGQAEGEQV